MGQDPALASGIWKIPLLPSVHGKLERLQLGDKKSLSTIGFHLRGTALQEAQLI